MALKKVENYTKVMRRKVNESKAIFDQLYGVYKNVKPKCKGLPKKRKNNSLNRLLDTLWSKAVKKLAKEKCEHCGSTQYLNSHHIFGRRNFPVRWNVNNGVCLCAKCHQFSSQFSAHQTPTLLTDWIRSKRGEEWYSQLVMMTAIPKLTLSDKEELREELEKIIYGKPRILPWE